MKKKILIVEDHPIVLEGITSLINNTGDFMVCAGTEKAENVFKLINYHKPDLIIVDLVLKERDGLDLIKDIRIFLYLLSSI